MDKTISTILKQFEDFIKRAVLPSASFFFVLMLELFLLNSVGFFDAGEYKETIIKVILTKKVTNVSVFVFFVLFLGLSYFLSIINQMIFDNFLKGNFNPPCACSEYIVLKKLRKKVHEKLREEGEQFGECKDYQLYQIVGRKLSYFKKETRTGRYVDDAKTIGIFFTSIIFSALMLCIVLPLEFLQQAVLIVLALYVYGLGRVAIMSKYRSRAIRLYTNFLLGEEK